MARRTMGRATKQMVATSHRLATDAGLAVLRSGGTAADAFVAAALVQDVVLPGVTSTAGLTGVLFYEAKSNRVTYVHGGLADPIDPAKRYRRGDTDVGKWVLIPGAPGAYAELVERFGTKALREVVEPAAKLAADGFSLDALYARSIERWRSKLEKSAYGKRTFFHDDGKPLAEGDIIELDEFAESLRGFGKDPRFFYRGTWVNEAIAVAAERGGALVPADFETYAPEIAAAPHGVFMGHDVFAAGRGGAKLLASLMAIENLREGAPSISASQSPDALETLVRVERAACSLSTLRDREWVTKGTATERTILEASAEIARQVRARAAPAGPASLGSHSSAVIAVDRSGNIAVGTHTVQALNWGEALFAGGIPLSTSAPTGYDDAVSATHRVRMDLLTASIVMRNGAPRAALTVYGTGLSPADVQILDSVIARGLNAEHAVLEPRVGYFQFDLHNRKIDMTKNVVDPRFEPELLRELRTRGIELETSMPGLPRGYVDTGFPTLVIFAEGEIQGMTPDPQFIHGVAAGD